MNSYKVKLILIVEQEVKKSKIIKSVIMVLSLLGFYLAFDLDTFGEPFLYIIFMGAYAVLIYAVLKTVTNVIYKGPEALFDFRIPDKDSYKSRLGEEEFSPQKIEYYLNRHWPLYRKLPDEIKSTVVKNCRDFLYNKRFISREGTTVNDVVKIVVAGHGCVMRVNHENPTYHKLYEIYIYRDAIDGNFAGLSKHGSIHLVWEYTEQGFNSMDYRNVVFHEFAHELDRMDGCIDGIPNLCKETSLEKWQKMLEYETYYIKKYRTEVRDYALTDHAELFAVMTEVFFEKPKYLKAIHPMGYDKLKKYYKLDPASWF